MPCYVLTTEHTILSATHTFYPQVDRYIPGQEAELAWVAGYIPRLFARPKTVTHPSTSRT